MTCTTCGRENPPHLTFCQECGQRLGPRIAPPTPPIGLGVEAGMPEAAPIPSRLATSLGAGPSPVAAAAQGQAQAQAAHAAHAHAPQAQQAQAPAGGERRCRICATPNGPNLRYCTSCGSTLEQSAAQLAPQPRMVEPAPVAPAPAPFAATALDPANAAPAAASPYGSAPLPPQPAPIAPMRVVDLGQGSRPPSEAPRTCGRCRGVVDAGAQFCKFCGASLAEAAPAASPYGPPPAPAAAAAPPSPSPASPPPSPSPAVAPLLPHERLELPRTNGHPASAAARPLAAGALDPPTPFASFPANAPPAPPAPASPPPAPAPPSPAPAPPSPAPPRAVTRGRLVVIAKSGADGPSYPIGDTLDVGRSEGQIIVGEDPYLSPRHVRIAWTGTKLVLRDLASTNGVYIRLVAGRDMNAGKPSARVAANDDKVPGEVAVPLHDQDLILVGQQVLRFESVKDGEAGFGPATEHGTLLFGSPAAPRYARLSQRTVEGVTRDVYYVRKVETVLGRESGDVVFTEDPFLSRRHAAIRVLGQNGASGRAPSSSKGEGRETPVQFALVDLGSSNGSFLRIRNEIELLPGDHFRVGQQLFRVDIDNETRDSRGRAG